MDTKRIVFSRNNFFYNMINYMLSVKHHFKVHTILNKKKLFHKKYLKKIDLFDEKHIFSKNYTVNINLGHFSVKIISSVLYTNK